jgi:hypothetical protein
MMHLGKLVHTQTGKYVLSVILGLGLASLFRTVCKGKNCIAFNAPPIEEIKDKVFKYDNKCYKYEPTQRKCDKSMRIVAFS